MRERKLQAFCAMSCDTTGVESMYWPSTLTSTSARNLLPGYLTGVLQTLMVADGPAIAIQGRSFVAQSDGTPPIGLSVQPPPAMVDTNDKDAAFTNPDVMEYILACEAVALNVFAHTGGWQIPQLSWPDQVNTNYAVVENHTGDDMTLAYGDSDGAVYPGTTQPVPAYSSALVNVTGTSKNYAWAYLTQLASDASTVATWWVPDPGSTGEGATVVDTAYDVANPPDVQVHGNAPAMWILPYVVSYAS